MRAESALDLTALMDQEQNWRTGNTGPLLWFYGWYVAAVSAISVCLTVRYG